MKKLPGLKEAPVILIRMTVGLVFLSEGIQKFILPELNGTGRFVSLGFHNPAFWAYFTACFELICGLLIIIGLFTRFASVPLLIVMATAFVTTKIPILMNKGFWTMAHEYRTDFAMTMLLVFLIIFGGGGYSLDNKMFDK